MNKNFKRRLFIAMAGIFSVTLFACSKSKEQEALDYVVDNLNLNTNLSNITKDFNLPHKVVRSGFDVNISWSSDIDEIKVVKEDDDYGFAQVSRPLVTESDAAGQLKATFKTEKHEKEKVFNVKVKKHTTALAAGEYNWKTTTDKELRIDALAAMESYLLDNGISTPLFSNSGAVMYSSRMSLYSETYIPTLGFGASRSDMTADDSTVKVSGVNGTAGKKTFRIPATSDPTTLNYLTSQSASESDIYGFLQLELFGFEFNEDKTGYVLSNLAAQNVIGLDETYDAQDSNSRSKKWRIELRDDLKWQNGTAITSEDYFYTLQQALDPIQANPRANYYYASSFPLVGAEEYFKQKEDSPVSFDTVKFTKSGNLAFEFELKTGFTLWELKYNFPISPVYKDLYEAGMSTTAGGAKVTDYGTAVNKYMAAGPYKLTYWENGVEVRLEKNENYFGKDKYKFTGINFVKVTDANMSLLKFLANELDYTSIPSSEFDNYRNDPKVKYVPGSTTFRINLNRYTDNELAANFPNANWTISPIVREDDFAKALYFAINREELIKNSTKTSTAEHTYFSQAYVVDPQTGLKYIDTPQAKAVAQQWGSATKGYNSELAKSYFKKALDSMKEKGLLTNKKIVVDFANFDGATQESVSRALKAQLEEVFNNITGYEDYTFELKLRNLPGMDLYYAAQMTGEYDLALCGISGGTLDPWGYMDVFSSSPENDLYLNYGFDTDSLDLVFKNETWTYDALFKALNEDATVVGGRAQ